MSLPYNFINLKYFQLAMKRNHNEEIDVQRALLAEKEPS
jgi:hypothetical protein